MWKNRRWNEYQEEEENTLCVCVGNKIVQTKTISNKLPFSFFLFSSFSLHDILQKEEEGKKLFDLINLKIIHALGGREKSHASLFCHFDFVCAAHFMTSLSGKWEKEKNLFHFYYLCYATSSSSPPSIVYFSSFFKEKQRKYKRSSRIFEIYLHFYCSPSFFTALHLKERRRKSF